MSDDLFDGEGVQFSDIVGPSAHKQRATQNRKLDAIEEHLADLQAEAERKKRLPKCPLCGGELEGQYKKCRHRRACPGGALIDR